MSRGSQSGRDGWNLVVNSGIGAVALLMGCGVYAQTGGDNISRPEELVVTATRTATPISQIGSSISVMAGEEMQHQQAQRVFDVLGQIPGVSAAGSESVAPRINIRGAPFQHTLVLIDGVRMTMPSFRRSEAINTISPENIERIEVLRGPQSTLYGGDAAAGVINIITRRGEGDPSGSVSLEYGSWNTRKGSAAVRGSNGRFDYSVDGGFLHSDWFSVGAPDGEADAREQESFSSRLGYEPNEAWRVESIFRWVETYREDDQFERDANRHNEESDFATRLQVTHAPPTANWENLFAVSYSGSDGRGFEDGSPRNSVREQRILQLDYQGNVTLPSGDLLTLGSEYNQQEVTGGIFEAVNPDDITNSAAFAQLQGSWGKTFYTIGGRYDHNSDFGSFPTYRASAAYWLNGDTTRLKANIGTGFLTPAMNQLTGTSSCPNGNADLEPEENISGELGVVHRFEGGVWRGLEADVTLFRNRITNVIVGSACEGGAPLQNKDRRESEGVEVAARWSPINVMNLRLAYTHIDAVDIVDGQTDQAEGIPRQMLSLGVRYFPIDRLELGTTIAYNSSRRDPPETLGSYALLNFTAEYQASERWSIYGRVANALDEDYQTRRRAQTAGRNVHAGFRMRF